ncbi:MAG: bifunctional ornithine acetyltransferase/N-acetylglutamate synthase, partial [Deltaproteobacteria bacterium]|nr:bifunctional ornithine acetyltransferase/N-acetylglutamate synthase [Deltaproteobacteria bacterium]
MHKDKITVPGFRASAMSVGLKKEKAPDLAMIVSETTTTAAAVFTTNMVKAAPVLVSREHLRDGRIRAVIANAGNANACTGEGGLINARKTAEMTAAALGVGTAEVVVASTGVIGAPLDMTRITPAIPELVRALEPEGIGRAAEAIMTTDSFPKISHYQGAAGGKPYRIVGVAKGAGMIMPDMATMLCFVMSDIAIEKEALQNALSEGVAGTFNRISVDGDTSTNDMVLVMANGFAKNDPLTAREHQDFREGLTSVMAGLAGMIVKDGEGATKVIHV